MNALMFRIVVEDDAASDIADLLWDALDQFCTQHNEEDCPIRSAQSRGYTIRPTPN